MSLPALVHVTGGGLIPVAKSHGSYASICHIYRVYLNVIRHPLLVYSDSQDMQMYNRVHGTGLRSPVGRASDIPTSLCKYQTIRKLE